MLAIDRVMVFLVSVVLFVDRKIEIALEWHKDALAETIARSLNHITEPPMDSIHSRMGRECCVEVVTPRNTPTELRQDKP